MTNASLRDESNYVLLMPDQPETFVTATELTAFLAQLVTAYPHIADPGMASTPTLQAERLIQTTCEVEIAPGETVQWYAVRLSKS